MRLLCELGVSIWLMASFCCWLVQTQTTEHTRLYGTFNVNRQPYNAYDDPRNRYASGSAYASSSSSLGSSLANSSSSANKDTIYWERTREQLRNQHAINTDRYSPNWGSNDRVYETRYDSPTRNLNSDTRSQGYDSRNPSFSRYPSSDSRSSSSGIGYVDSRNQNYDSKDLFNSKVPNFQTGGGGGGGGSSSYQGQSPSIVSGVNDRDRGSLSQSNWEREKEREREREREQERERGLERERSYYLNSRTRVNTNPINNQNYGQNNARTKLPGLYLNNGTFCLKRAGNSWTYKQKFNLRRRLRCFRRMETRFDGYVPARLRGQRAGEGHLGDDPVRPN